MAPSALHVELTKRTRRWLKHRVTGAGMDWASEVYLAESYVADAVAIGSLQHRFWLEAIKSNIEEYRTSGSHDRIIAPEKLTMVFETKVSRNDLLCTFRQESGNRLSPIANLHYLVVSESLTNFDCLPEWWGILRQSGNGLGQLRPARFCDITEAALWHAGFRVLLAQHRNPRCFICLGQTEQEPHPTPEPERLPC